MEKRSSLPIIEGSSFGKIVIDGITYDHDVVITLSGKITKRKKKLSKKYFGTSHIISIEEADFLYEKGMDELIIGAGMNDSVTLSPEAENFFDRHKCTIHKAPTPEAVEIYNSSVSRKVGLFHVTC
ncbi:MAG: hypothetical protein JW971_06705 [Synergistales bacterium]|nr:hypothetical protein [Synergistales bacterium]